MAATRLRPGRPRRSPWLPAALAAAALAATLASCAGPAQLRYEERLRSVAPPARHGVHSERLEQVMEGLERLSIERLPQALDGGEERRARGREVAEIARAMAESASQIPEAVDDLQLGPDEREEFFALSWTLRDRCLELSRRAPGLSREALRAERDAIRETCDACHVRFRVRAASGG